MTNKITKLSENDFFNTSGTHRVGELTDINYNKLLKILGEPTYDYPSEDHKKQLEWVLLYNDNIYTIYDWKTYSREYTTNELTTWSIGGKTNPDELIEYMLYTLEN